MGSVVGTQDEGMSYEVVGSGVNRVRKRSRGYDEDSVTSLSNVSHEGVAYCVNTLGGALVSAHLLCWSKDTWNNS
jgi:hypothetical protein